MVKALDSVDGIGLGRPLCQEPRLCADILSGQVKGAIKLKLDDNDFGATIGAAGAQLKQVGKDQEPIDLSQQDNVDVLLKDTGLWYEKLGGDSAMELYGHVDIDSIDSVPYGTVAA
jgi:hypothetical protein